MGPLRVFGNVDASQQLIVIKQGEALYRYVTASSAIEKARDLAEASPGTTYEIYELKARVKAKVQPAHVEVLE